MADRPAQDAAEHVAAAVVRRVHPVGEQEGHGTGMVGQDAVRRPLPSHAARIGPSHQGRHALEQRHEQVGVEVVVLALQHRRDPLQASPGVHGWFRQRRQGAIGRPIELHEHQVPDLEEPPGLRLRLELRLRQDWRGGSLPPLEVHVDLGTGAAGSRLAHLPEIVLVAQPEDPAVGQGAGALPQLARFRIGMVDRHPQAIGVKAKVFRRGDELPRVGDRVLLEIIPEGEVAQHLEEGMMSLRQPDLFQVVVLAAGPDAFLAGDGAAVIAVLLAQERPLELDHAGVGEQEGRVVGGDQRRRRHLAVPVPGEVVEKELPERICVHGRNIESRRGVS